MLFSDYMLEWLDEVIKTQVKASTHYQYGLIIKNSVIPFFEKQNVSLQDLQPIHIQKYYSKMIKDGLSGNTVKHHHANIHKTLELPKIKEFSVTFYNDREMKELMERAKGTLIETPVLLAATLRI